MVKLKSLLIFLTILFSVNAQNGSFQNTIAGGLALAMGSGSDDVNPGINVYVEPVTKVCDYFGLGARIDYTWLSVDIPSGYDVRGGYNFWDVSFVPKLLVPFSKDINFFADIDPGFCLAMIYAKSSYGSHSEVKPKFIMSYNAGFAFSKLVLGFKIKSVLIEGDHLNWITFNLGFNAG